MAYSEGLVIKHSYVGRLFADDEPSSGVARPILQPRPIFYRHLYSPCRKVRTRTIVHRSESVERRLRVNS